MLFVGCSKSAPTVQTDPATSQAQAEETVTHCINVCHHVYSVNAEEYDCIAKCKKDYKNSINK